MTDFAEAPVVLSATRNGSDLVLRIDSNLWNTDVSGSEAVRVVTIQDAQVEDGEDPAAWVGHHLSIHEFADAGSHLLELYVNYAADYVEVRCRATTSTAAPYSSDDLHVKLQTITEVARQYAAQAAEAERELQRIHREIGATLRRELDVGERKRDFFATSRPQRAQAIESELKLLKILSEKLERGPVT
jgi:hypothetical protein